MANGNPARAGEHYEDSEIALLYIFARSSEAKELLAELLKRSEEAIDMVWRWIEHAGFPAEADNKIKRQVERIENILGEEQRGTVDVSA